MGTSLLDNLLGGQSREHFFASFPNTFFCHHGPLDRLSAVANIGELENVNSILAAYKDPISVWLSPSASDVERSYGDAMSPEVALQKYEEGALLQLNEVEKWVPDLNGVMKELERELSLIPDTITCSLFASTTGGGVLPHYDADPAFSLQLGGEKRWWVAPQSEVIEPIDNFVVGGGRAAMAEWHDGDVPTSMSQDAIVVDMRPGSVLFIPRGYLHKTESKAASFAITFDLLIPNAADVVAKYFSRVLRRDPQFRRHVLGLRDKPEAVEKLLRPLLPGISDALERLQAAPHLAATEMTPKLVPGPRMRFGVSNATISVLDGSSPRIAVMHPKKGATELELPDELYQLACWMLQPTNSFTAMDARTFDPELQLIDVAHVLNALIEAGAIEGKSAV